MNGKKACWKTSDMVSCNRNGVSAKDSFMPGGIRTMIRGASARIAVRDVRDRKIRVGRTISTRGVERKMLIKVNVQKKSRGQGKGVEKGIIIKMTIHTHTGDSVRVVKRCLMSNMKRNEGKCDNVRGVEICMMKEIEEITGMCHNVRGVERRTMINMKEIQGACDTRRERRKAAKGKIHDSLYIYHF
jgi:hypothetical protein